MFLKKLMCKPTCAVCVSRKNIKIFGYDLLNFESTKRELSLQNACIKDKTIIFHA